MTEQKPKPRREDYMFQQMQNRHDLIKKPGEIEGLPFAIRNLDDCTVQLLDHSAQVMVDNCNNTKMIIGPVKGSIFVRNCNNCTVHVATSQFRCRDVTNTSIFLHAQNDPVIEASSNLRFAPYNIAYQQLGAHVQAAGLNPNENKWELVFDFSNKGESNFTMIPPEEFQIQTIQLPDIAGEAQVVLGYPQRYGGALSDAPPASSAEHMAFGMDTSQAAAQQISDSVQAQQEAAQSVPVTTGDIFSAGAGEQTQAYQAPVDMGGFPQMQAQSSSSGMPQMQMQSQGEFSVFNSSAQPSLGGLQFATTQVVAGQENDYNEEEMELIREAELRRQARFQEVNQQRENELRLKEERRSKARAALEQWEEERKKHIAVRRETNIQNEASAMAEEQSMKQNPNKWLRICNSCDFQTATSAAGKDLTRMRDVMLSRKQDMVNGGQQSFGF